MHDLRADADNVDVWSDSDWTRRLNKHATTDRYTPAEIDDLPEPVQRYFTSAIAEGTILAKTVRLRMRGFIKVGMWLPFRARQLSNPHVGFRWTARAVGLISGFDRYVHDAGVMQWNVAGRFPVAMPTGPTSRRAPLDDAVAKA